MLTFTTNFGLSFNLFALELKNANYKLDKQLSGHLAFASPTFRFCFDVRIQNASTCSNFAGIPLGSCGAVVTCDFMDFNLASFHLPLVHFVGACHSTRTRLIGLAIGLQDPFNPSISQEDSE